VTDGSTSLLQPARNSSPQPSSTRCDGRMPDHRPRRLAVARNSG
jgi:hypothetical protein